MSKNTAHKQNAQWIDGTPPEETGYSRVGRLRFCSHCGSMHPSDVAAAIKSGAVGEWADQKYGWPHKAYFDGVPNPWAGLLEVRASANYESEGWIKCGDHWHEPPRPAAPLTNGKFYSVHLVDATPEEVEVIESHMGLHFDFGPDGTLQWKRKV